MEVIIVLLFVTRVTCAYVPCGQPEGCMCSEPVLHDIACTNVTVFPLFPSHLKDGVLTIRIYGTQIVDMHPFLKRDWPRLQELDFHDNKHLSCRVIEKLQRDDLHITCDCYKTSDCLYKTKNKTANVVFPIISGVSFVLSILTTIGALMRWRR